MKLLHLFANKLLKMRRCLREALGGRVALDPVPVENLARPLSGRCGRTLSPCSTPRGRRAGRDPRTCGL